MHTQSLSHIQPFDPTDCSLPGFTVYGIIQARILEWAAIYSSRGSSQPRDWTCISPHLQDWKADSLPQHLGSPQQNLCAYVCSVSHSCLTLCNSMDCSPPGCPWNFPDKNIGVGCHILFLPDSGIEPALLHLLHWQADFLPLRYVGSPTTEHSTQQIYKTHSFKITWNI